MNTAAIPVPQLTCLLADTAAGDPADLAAIELLSLHGHFLPLPQFQRIIAAGSASASGEPVTVIRWRAAIHALDNGQLPATGTEAFILRFAASLADDSITVALRTGMGRLDHRNIGLLTQALTSANS